MCRYLIQFQAKHVDQEDVYRFRRIWEKLKCKISEIDENNISEGLKWS
jgi:hypothetical protein